MPLGEIAYTQEQIRRRVEELAGSLREQLDGERPLLVSVLQGSVVFLADLARALAVECDVDFLSVSSYPGHLGGGGVVRIIKDLDILPEGRHVVLIEDVVDTGMTLAFLLRTLQTRNPGSLTVCTLVDKPVRRIAAAPIDHVGFESDEFLVGYGLDFQGKYRNLPYLVAVGDVHALARQPGALEGYFRKG